MAGSAVIELQMRNAIKDLNDKLDAFIDLQRQTNALLGQLIQANAQARQFYPGPVYEGTPSQ